MREGSGGMTVVELLFALLILAMLWSLAAPMARHLSDRVRWQVTVGEAFAQIGQARVLAIERRRQITWCASADGLRCNPDWQHNWLMFVDHNGNGVLDERDELLRQDAIALRGARIEWRSFRRLPFLQFTSDGLGNSSNGALLFCDIERRPGWDRKIVVNRIGRARVEVTRPDGWLLECQR